MSLTVIVHTKNSAKTVESALKSVTFAETVIVVDMHSSDETRTIAKKYASATYLFEDVGYVEPARNFALSKVKTEWVLILDADEVLPVTLKRKIVAELEHPQADAYFLPRSNSIFGKEIESDGWWPDYQLRLFKNGVIEWSDAIHSVPVIKGSSSYFPADRSAALFHLNYTSISQFVERLNNYTTIQARQNGASETATVAKVVAQFRTELLSRLFAQKAIDEGMHGLALSFLQSFSEVVVVLKQWEAEGSLSTQADQATTIKELRLFQKELNYWISDWEVTHRTPLHSLIARVRRKLQW